jgi:hypothetical protein
MGGYRKVGHLPQSGKVFHRVGRTHSSNRIFVRGMRFNADFDTSGVAGKWPPDTFVQGNEIRLPPLPRSLSRSRASVGFSGA